ncbi:MAG TPA: histidine phosphatase family protein [Acidimicrobiales bacterium]
MKVLLIRHAIAVRRGTPGIPDDERPLTEKGEKRFRQCARGLARLVRKPDQVLTSPLPRAARTAELAAKAWGRGKPKADPALASGSIRQMLAMLGGWPKDSTIAIVGHEPDLSALLAHLLGGARCERLTFRKGGAALLELPGTPGQGGRLVWYLRPRVLRTLGRT